MKNIVTFPCSVGDIIYLPAFDDEGRIISFPVIELGVDKDGMFFRVDDEDKEKIRGEELGVSAFLSKEQAEQRSGHGKASEKVPAIYDSLAVGGDIWYYDDTMSVPEKGTITSLRLPAVDAPAWDRGSVWIAFSDASLEFSLGLLRKTLFLSEYDVMVSTGGEKERPSDSKASEPSHRELSDAPCPCCGEKRLRLAEFGGSFPDIPDYQVVCDDCDWVCPVPPLSDCGEALGLFWDWERAFADLGRPANRVHDDLVPDSHPWVPCEDFRSCPKYKPGQSCTGCAKE